MGTYFRIQFPEFRAAKATIDLNTAGTLSEVDRLMSTYLSDSEVSHFNAAAPGEPISISPHTNAVIEEAFRVGKLSNGAFDVTIGPLVDLWGFGPSRQTGKIPDGASIRHTAMQVGMDGLHSAENRLWKSKSGLGIDLSGIAKGYAVDQLARLLDAQNLPGYLIDIGGELRAKGRRPDGRQWTIGIERPVQGQRKAYRVVRLEDAAVATSGDYRNFFVSGGQSYSHVIDPRTTKPVAHSLASVTVLDQSTMRADALSTALMVMGPDEGRAFAEQSQIAAYFLVREGRRLNEFYSSAFEPYLQEST
ncbi:FAD:protein FMN transferase [Ruegeria pomeroyi]|nr:FAD:protein FMN transferase [Ruegeria pomeroyi]MCE8534631.1 FAD:protein FMN transferase [Ruegeria pomeroyi]